jgi:hypothetical protein
LNDIVNERGNREKEWKRRRYEVINDENECKMEK